MSRCGIKTGGFLVHLIFTTLYVTAQTSVASIPDALVLEVVTAPGYSFMDGCADPKMMSGQSTGTARPPAGSSPAAATGTGDEADHAAHHPGGTAPRQSATLPDERSREKTLEELDRTARFFGALGSGARTVDMKTEPVAR